MAITDTRKFDVDLMSTTKAKPSEPTIPVFADFVSAVTVCSQPNVPCVKNALPSSCCAARNAVQPSLCSFSMSVGVSSLQRIVLLKPTHAAATYRAPDASVANEYPCLSLVLLKSRGKFSPVLRRKRSDLRSSHVRKFAVSLPSVMLLRTSVATRAAPVG